MKKIVPALIIGCFLFVHCTNRSTWNDVFHADEAHTGVYRSAAGRGLGPVRWKFKTNGKIFSSPVIKDGLAYIGSEDSNLYAIRTYSGALSWKFHTGGAVSSSPALFNGMIYFTSYDGYCYSLDATTGRELWKFKTGGEKKVGANGLWTMKPSDMYMEDLWDFFLSSPVVGVNGPGNYKGPTVYFGSSDGNLYALDAITGSFKWKFRTNGIIHTSPALYEGVIFFGSWDNNLYAVDAQTGKEIWKFKTRDQPVYHVLEGIEASPAVADGVLYFGARDGLFYALKTKTGDSLWSFSADNSWVLTTAAIFDSTVFFGTSDTYTFYALDTKTGRKKFSMKATGYLYSSPAISRRTAYFGDFTGNFYALDLRSGGKNWQTFSTDNRKSNAAGILNPKGELDFAYTGGKDDMSLYSSSVKVMNKFYTLGSIVSSPAVYGSSIYFGSTDGNLYAIGLQP
jgi:eukaryotic-like serine/threonine-protein kinase